MRVDRKLTTVYHGASLYLNADILGNSGLSAGDTVMLTVEKDRIVIEKKIEEKQKSDCMF